MQEHFSLFNHVDNYSSLKDFWQFAVWDDYFHYYFINLTRSPTDFLCITDPFVPEIIKNASLEQQTTETLWQINVQKCIACTVANSVVLYHFCIFSTQLYMDSLTIGIDPWCRFPNARPFNWFIGYVRCWILYAVFTSLAPQTQGEVAVPRAASAIHSSQGGNCKLEFALPVPCLLATYT